MGLSQAEREKLIEQYARGPARVKEALARVPKEALQWRPAEGKWSVHEVVVHCADSETNASLRIRYLIAEKEPLIVGYDQEAWARVFDYHAQPIEDALVATAAARGRTLPVLRQMSEADWAKAGRHTESGAYTRRGLAAQLRQAPGGSRQPDRAQPRGMDGPRIASPRAARRAASDAPVTLSGMDRSGAAVASVGDERLLVPGGIPGERVRVKRLRPVGRSVLCEIVTVEEASPNRVTPRCRHAGVCGGCAWQHIAYPEQLRRKAAALDVLLRRSMGKDAPRVLPTIGMPPGTDGMPWRFRQKAAFVFDAGPSGLAMGHFARGTNEVVAVSECPVHSQRANRIAFAMRDALVAAGVSGSGPRTSGLVRHVVVRTTKDDSEAVAMLVAARDDAALRAPLEAVASGPEKPEGLVLNLNDRPGPYLVGRESKRVAGTGHVKEQSLGPAFLVSPSSFFQTNVAAAATLVRLVVEALPGESGLRVLDLYSGSGLFALPLAVRGHRVTAVEESRKSVKDAELNRQAEQGPRRAAEARLLCGREGPAASRPRLVRRRDPRPAARGLAARGDARRLRAAQAGARDPRLLRSRGSRARAAARRGRGLPGAARSAGGHVPAHAAHRGGGGARAARRRDASRAGQTAPAGQNP